MEVVVVFTDCKSEIFPVCLCSDMFRPSNLENCDIPALCLFSDMFRPSSLEIKT